MITAATPLRTTLVFGLGSALMFIPLHLFFSTILSGLVYSTLIFRLVLWTYLGLYAVLLAIAGFCLVYFLEKLTDRDLVGP